MLKCIKKHSCINKIDKFLKKEYKTSHSILCNHFIGKGIVAITNKCTPQHTSNTNSKH